MSVRSAIATAVLLVALGACASASAPSREGSRVRSGDRNLLTAAQLDCSHWPNMYDAITAIRGAWLLNKRGPVSLSNPGDLLVYLDRNRLGGRETLRGIPCNMVETARYLSSPEAQSQFGLDHPFGAIVITSRTR